MIKSENGLTHIKGTYSDFMSDYGCLTASLVKLLLQRSFTKDEIKEEVSKVVSISVIHGFEAYEKEKKQSW